MSNVSARPSRLLTYAGYYAFVLIGWNIVLIPSLIRWIEHDFKQTDAAFGLLYLIGALMNAAGASLGGMLTERLGRRIVLSSGALLLAIGFVGEALAPSWLTLMLVFVPVSWGGGVIDSGINGLFLDLYRDARGGALNLLHLFFSLGALMAPFVIGQLITAGVPWRLIVLVGGIAGLALAALLFTIAMPTGRHERTPSASGPEALTAAESSLRPFFLLAAGICLYVAAEIAVSNWIVRFLASVPVATATLVLSMLWAGIALGRLLSNWLAERIDYFAFTIGCALLGGLTLLSAVLIAPALPLTAALVGLTGVFYGPIYPMIMAIGGNIYPHRLAALSGGLAGAAIVGGVIYPPLMGIMAAQVGLKTGMIGAAILGLPTALCMVGVRAAWRRANAPTTAAAHAGRQRRVGR